MMSKWYEIADISSIDSPSLLVYPTRVAQNISNMVSMVGDPTRLRPHIKTHKTAEGIHMMMDAGIRKFKCATIAEAELLGICGAPDVLLAYQPHGPKLHRLVHLMGKFPDTTYACLVDNEYSADLMAEAFLSAGHEVPVYLDLNVGMNRTGIIADERVVDLYRHCFQLRGIRPVGLHAYDGHHRQTDLSARKTACDISFDAVSHLRERITESGLPEPVVIIGGSPTFPIHAARQDVDCSPGTGIFWDKCYSDLCQEQPFQPAAVLLTRVLSLPTDTRVCLDLGHKSVASENEIGKRVFFPDAPTLKPVSQSEEHLVMEAPAGHGYRPGDVLYGIPYHICPTVALYECLVAVEDGKVSGEWKVAARARRLSV
jgi:D-serine deaminase-like pyridoxal phosphate-dependent protein